MRDYWLTQSLLQAVGIGFGLLALTGLALALWLPKKWWGKLLGVAVVVFLISIPVRKVMQEQATQQVKADDYKERYAKAKALFDERCKTAGEKIYRTVENVEAIQLLKIRPLAGDGAGADPMYPGAAMYMERGNEDYIASFLKYETAPQGSMRGQLSDKPTSLPGYRLVVVVDEVDGKRYGYTKLHDVTNISTDNNNHPLQMKKSVLQTGNARYAVTYEDLLDPEDRKHWVAGTVLAIVDLQTKEVIAEHRRFLFDNGLGNTSGSRNPWGWAVHNAPSCPKHSGFLGQTTRQFVDQVIKPFKGE